MLNPITLIDGYKLDHRRQYPQGTKLVYSNWTPRTSRIDNQNEVVFFGLQYFLKKYLMEDFQEYFFNKPVDDVCKEYERRVNGYLGPNQIGSQHIRDLHKLGYLPLRFCSIREGVKVPLRIPMLTVENTHDDFFWLVNYFETILSNVLWLPCTSATTASRMRKLLNSQAVRTGAPLDFVQWQGHDFSFRGMAGPEAAALSGAGHLIYFTGTDTIPALDLIEQYYNPTGFIGGSVAATEHSVMCAGGEVNELDTFNRLLDLYPEGIISIVSDTWDLWKVITKILPACKDRIMKRNGKVVIRPDSGDPVKIICGDPDAVLNTPEYKGTIELLWDLFNGTDTTTGHRLLDPHIGCIYGDSITHDRANAICNGLARKGFASTNMVFGIGSYTYQYVTRDTYGFAMKATYVNINGDSYDIFKKPKTDDGMKNSAKGRLAVFPTSGGGMQLVNQANATQESLSLLTPAWENGKFVRVTTFDRIRDRALGGL